MLVIKRELHVSIGCDCMRRRVGLLNERILIYSYRSLRRCVSHDEKKIPHRQRAASSVARLLILVTAFKPARVNLNPIKLDPMSAGCPAQNRDSLGLERLGLEAVSRLFLERLSLVSVLRVERLGLISVLRV